MGLGPGSPVEISGDQGPDIFPRLGAGWNRNSIQPGNQRRHESRKREFRTAGCHSVEEIHSHRIALLDGLVRFTGSLFLLTSLASPGFEFNPPNCGPRAAYLGQAALQLSNSTSNETSGAFSPAISKEGPRWIAYTSDESGRSEIYVKNFPAHDRKWQISTHGGWMPHWRHDGKELFYLALDGTLMAVEVSEGPDFSACVPYCSIPTFPRRIIR